MNHSCVPHLPFARRPPEPWVMETTTRIREATTTTPRRGHPLLRRWPTLVGLACGGFILFTAEPWQAADFVTWGLPMLALAYLIFGAFRGELRGRGVLTLQGGALAVYVLLAVAAFAVAPDLGRYLVAAGWAAHAAWDYVHHRSGRVVPRWYAEWCISVDLLVAASVLVLPAAAGA
ncbi:hypothetical protein GCM10010412_101700 [Nonomuraea recticatena]|uniref:DUF4260 family protein n=2 Tax=Nonomuraea recticatena TaxID=46178 RepID=A0ABN3THN7_9ACTN